MRPVVSAPLEQVSDPHHVDVHGRTCLHYAVSRGHTEVVRILLAQGCDAQLADNIGTTPIATACLKPVNKYLANFLKDTASIDYKALLFAAVE